MSVDRSMQKALADAALPISGMRHFGNRIGAVRFQFQAGNGEKIVVGDFVNSGNVTPEEILEASAGDLLNRCADAFAIVVEFSLPGILFVHQAQYIIERF